MDQGHGLLDRFLYLFPLCLCPSTTKTKAACLWFESHELPLKQVSDIFLEMHDAQDTPSSPYIFTEVKEKLKTLKDDFIQEVNDAMEMALPNGRKSIYFRELRPAFTCLITPLLNS